MPSKSFDLVSDWTFNAPIGPAWRVAWHRNARVHDPPERRFAASVQPAARDVAASRPPAKRERHHVSRLKAPAPAALM